MLAVAEGVAAVRAHGGDAVRAAPRARGDLPRPRHRQAGVPGGAAAPAHDGLIFLRLVSIVLVLRLSLNGGRATAVGRATDAPHADPARVGRGRRDEAARRAARAPARRRPARPPHRLLHAAARRRHRAGAGLARSAIPITAFLLVLTTLSRCGRVQPAARHAGAVDRHVRAETMAAAAAADPRCGLPPTSRRRPATRRTPPRSKCRSSRRTCGVDLRAVAAAHGSPSSRASSATSPTTSSAASSPRRRCAGGQAGRPRQSEGARRAIAAQFCAIVAAILGGYFLAQLCAPRSDAPHPAPFSARASTSSPSCRRARCPTGSPCSPARRRRSTASSATSPSRRSRTTRCSSRRRHGVHAGIAASPWMVNPVKRWLPLLDGDGRVSSSADGAYETTANGTTVKLDDARHAAALAARTSRGTARTAALRRRDGQVLALRDAPANVDSIGHRKGATTDTLPYVEPARAKDQVEALMRDLPDNPSSSSSDHGHEPGGSGGASDDARKTRMWVFQKALVDEGEDATDKVDPHRPARRPAHRPRAPLRSLTPGCTRPPPHHHLPPPARRPPACPPARPPAPPPPPAADRAPSPGVLGISPPRPTSSRAARCSTAAPRRPTARSGWSISTTISLIRGLPARATPRARSSPDVPDGAADRVIAPRPRRSRNGASRTILAVEQLDEVRLRPLADLEQDALRRRHGAEQGGADAQVARGGERGAKGDRRREGGGAAVRAAQLRGDLRRRRAARRDGVLGATR